ncbi:hypothetical protein RA28_06560 [Ruegeria sp. ANG-S4]|nr:hypothetical protein RA28_06560 [Ruegeria sp. ANG-S4]
MQNDAAEFFHGTAKFRMFAKAKRDPFPTLIAPQCPPPAKALSSIKIDFRFFDVAVSFDRCRSLL